MRILPAALVCLAACGQSDNLIVGGVSAGETTPEILFDNIGSSIHGVATMRDQGGNPVGGPMSVVIMSDKPNLCSRLKATPGYFRNPPEAYEALILITRKDYVGTFIVGRPSDPGTAGEIVGATGPLPPDQQTTPFHALDGSYIAVTEWSDTGGNAMGSFNMLFDDPYGTGTGHQFYGKFKTSFCPTLEGTLLP